MPFKNNTLKQIPLKPICTNIMVTLFRMSSRLDIRDRLFQCYFQCNVCHHVCRAYLFTYLWEHYSKNVARNSNLLAGSGI